MRLTKNDDELMAMLAETGALLKGHFLLSSGLHSDTYVQCARLLSDTDYAEWVGDRLALPYINEHVDVVIGGAFGGIILAQEVARSIVISCVEARAIFAERVDGKFTLRRGFEINEGERVLIAEDVCTTGKSTRELIDLVREHGGEPIGAAIIIDRAEPAGEDIGVRKEFLQTIHAQTYEADACPLCKDGSTPYKPGSRK